MKAARSLGVASLLALGLLAAGGTTAQADFGSIRLISRIVTEQAPQALAPVLSADGHYVAFQGTLEGRKGVFRADLQSGVIARVATGNAYEQGAPGADSAGPSISADGRYVAFTTRAELDPAADLEPASQDVYVADMNALSPTYQLASALDGSAQAIGGDSVASPRVALSADGRKVVFVNAGAAGAQVFLRNLDTSETTLVSAARNAATGMMEPGVPVPGGAVIEALAGLRGAALSADGTTVAWMGAHLPDQVPLLSDEAVSIATADSGLRPYTEPLWRRVADGPLAPTRRVIGGGDPFAPGCPGTSGTLAEPACRGPFPNLTNRAEPPNQINGWLAVNGVNGVPRLSADGTKVALIGNPTEASNVFLVDMGAGLSRVQAMRQLTAQITVEPANEGAVINIEPFIPLNGYIYDLAISADGKRIAFTTGRQRFPLAPPNLVTAPPIGLGLVELYLIDLGTESMQRLSHGFAAQSEPSLPQPESQETAQAGDGAGSPSLAADGRVVAFTSPASNLVVGDGNDGVNAGDDVFVIDDDVLPTITGGSEISRPPRQPRLPRRPRLALSAFSLPSGKVRLVAVAPAAGRLWARATTSLAVGSGPRKLDDERARARANKPVSMTLSLPPRLRHLARTQEGLYATARIGFRGRQGRRLRGQVQVRFLVHRAKGERR